MLCEDGLLELRVERVEREKGKRVGSVKEEKRVVSVRLLEELVEEWC